MTDGGIYNKGGKSTHTRTMTHFTAALRSLCVGVCKMGLYSYKLQITLNMQTFHPLLECRSQSCSGCTHIHNFLLINICRSHQGSRVRIQSTAWGIVGMTFDPGSG